MLHDPSASQLSKPIFITLTLKKLDSGDKIGQKFEKKSQLEEKVEVRAQTLF